MTLDTTRADRIGCYGNTRIETPNFDQLAREGTRFANAFTPVPSTLPSHCSIMTGTYPARHGVHDNGIYRLEEGFTTLAERFLDRGYRTAAFVSAFVLDAKFGLDQGFEVYDDDADLSLIERDNHGLEQNTSLSERARKWIVLQTLPYQRRADAVTLRATEWLSQIGDEPFFLWVHYFDPHASYQPPSPWDLRYDPEYQGELDGNTDTFWRVAYERRWTRGSIPRREMDHMIARYDGEISFVDEWFGRLRVALEEKNRWDKTLVVVVGDHGEGFGEHNNVWEHNGQIFDETARVPLIIRRAAESKPGTVVSELVRTIDVVPTVLAEVGLPSWPEIQGLPLFPAGGSQAAIPREILLQALREEQLQDTPTSWLGLRTKEYKLVLLLGPEDQVRARGLFDLRRDPGEQGNIELTAYELELMDRWTQRTLETYGHMKTMAGKGGQRSIDEMASEALRSLGYIE